MKRSLLALLLVACSSSSATGSADPPASDATPAAPTPPPPPDGATMVIAGVDAESFSSEGYALTSVEVDATVDGASVGHASFDPSSLPRELRVNAPKDRLDAPVVITVVAKMNDAAVVTRRVTTRFVPRAAKLAYVRLEVRCNDFALLGGSGISGPTCDKPGETCIGGACRSDAMPDLPDYRTDWASAPPSACGAGADATLDVGQGQSARAPLADGDTVALECGPQGGHHLWVSLGMKNLGQFSTVTKLEASRADAGTLVATAYPYTWSPIADGSCELTGLRFQLDVGGRQVSDFLGKPLDLTVQTTDRQGHDVKVTRHLQIASAPTGSFCR